MSEEEQKIKDEPFRRPLHFENVGRCKKSFGIKGFMRCAIEPTLLDDLESGMFLFIEIDGINIPFQIEQLDRRKSLIKFSDIDDPESAMVITNRDLFLEVARERETVVSTLADQNQWVGYQVRDLNSEKDLGFIKEIEQYPSQLMAVVEGEYGELLIPLVDHFIADDQRFDKVLIMELPDGFLDI